jgi:hypothetical protein
VAGFHFLMGLRKLPSGKLKPVSLHQMEMLSQLYSNFFPTAMFQLYLVRTLWASIEYWLVLECGLVLDIGAVYFSDHSLSRLEASSGLILSNRSHTAIQ